MSRIKILKLKENKKRLSGGILGIILLVLGFLSIPASQVEAFTPIGDYMRIQLDVGGNSMRKFYSTGAGTTEVFDVVAAAGDYWVGGVQYQCGLLITEEEPLAFDNHWIWWVRDGTILKWGIDGTNSLATNIAGKSINCCNNGDPQCAMDFLVLCTFFGANVLVNEPYSIGWADNCAGTDCNRASGDTIYQHSVDRLCMQQWLECGSGETSCNGDYACNNTVWTDCAATGQTCDVATGTCIAAGCNLNPQVTITNSPQSGVAGAALTYTYEVKNMDAVGCASRTFNMSSTPPPAPPGWTETLVGGPFTLAPQATSSGTYTLQSPGGTPPGNYNFTITATDPVGSGQSTGIYTVTTCSPLTYTEFTQDKYRIGTTLLIDYAIGNFEPVNDFVVCVYDPSPPPYDLRWTINPPIAHICVGPGCGNIGGNISTVAGDTLGTWTASLEVGVSCPGAPSGCIDSALVVECLVNADCASNNCNLSTNTCVVVAVCNNNGVQDNGETGIDCGGGGCPPCGGPVCNNNGIQDNGETGIDCGGGGCPPCGGPVCNNNGIQDNGETGIDCGGGGCPACGGPVGPACPPETPPGGLIPCGRTCDDLSTPTNEAEECTLCHFFLMIKNGVDFLMKIGIMIALFLIVMSGFVYVFSLGEPQKINQAKTILTWSIGGFIIMLIGWLIVAIILAAFGYIDPLSDEWSFISC